MHIGLIGGIGPAATDVYYRALISKAAKSNRDLELTIVHADTPTLLDNLTKDDQAAQCDIFLRLTDRLQTAGAGCVVVTSIAGHFCIDPFTKSSPLQVIDLTKVLSEWLKKQGLRQVGVLGTGTVMATKLYGKLPSVEVIAPAGAELQSVNDAYVALAKSGQSTPELQGLFFKAGRDLIDRGAEAVLLGGTDLNAAFSGTDCGFPIVDCAGVHIEEIAQLI